MGYGVTTNGINENNTVIDWHGLLSIHMPAYYNSIIEGVSTVMVSYSSWNGVEMHSNHNLVTRFLKDTLKFKVNITIYEKKTLFFSNVNYINKLSTDNLHDFGRVFSSLIGKDLIG